MGSKEKKAKLQIIIFTLLLVLVAFGELYIMINSSGNYMLIITLLIMALIAVYVILDGVIVISSEKNSRKEEQFDTLLKSEKAAYLLQKKNFEEIQEQLAILEENSKVPSEEIINAQKGIAKVIISRSKENADAIISSNDQVLERLEEIETTQNHNLEEVLEKQKNANADSKNKMESKLQDIILNTFLHGFRNCFSWIGWSLQSIPSCGLHKNRILFQLLTFFHQLLIAPIIYINHGSFALQAAFV